MKQALHVRLSQHLALTPQLQQSIRLLQLSTLELQQEVEQMLDDNPFLELEASDDDDLRGLDLSSTPAIEPPRVDDDGAAPSAAHEDEGDADRGLDRDLAGGAQAEDWSNGTEGDDFEGIRETTRGIGDDEEGGESQERVGDGPSLADHLREQALGLRMSTEDAALLQALIDSLDEDGYLADPLEGIAERLMNDAGRLDDADMLEELLERLRCTRALLQSMEPCGVGAADLPDCLCLQLKRMPRSEAQAIAVIIARQHLDLLAKRDFRKLAAVTGADEPLLRQAQALIVTCEPKPGRRFARTEHQVIVPDVIVRKSGRGFKVSLNQDVMPRLRINDLYAQALRGQRGQGPLGVRLQEARWFVKNIKQRFDTILRVSTAIVERQRSFFTHGEIAMRPLVLREIADELGLHESTISRVTTAKYMATPQGTFELKYFFGSSLNTETGGNASSTAVRALIRQFVTAEDRDKPLSDNQLAAMLAEQGIQVARRTVAKYREALRIAPATQRRDA